MEEMTIEEAFEELKKILASMQEESITLEDSFAQYERGMQLIKYCSEKIDGVEKKIEKLNADGSREAFAEPETL